MAVEPEDRLRLDDFFTRDFAALDYAALHDAFDWVRNMAETRQDPHYHAEGDVWTHTRMVCDAISADEVWPFLSAEERHG